MKRGIKKITHLVAIALLGTSILGGCQSSDNNIIAAKQVPKVVSAEFFPPSVFEGDPIVVRARGKGKEGDVIVFRYAWFINNKPAHDTRELPSSLFKRGDKISVEITPNDGMNDGPVFKTSELQVQNTPPEILSIKLSPQPLRPGETITAQTTARDREGDPIEYSYEWLKNSIPLFLENRAQVKISDLQRGDTITVRITPHDGRDAGKSFDSLDLKTNNRQPVITSNPPHQFKNGIYTYPMQAFDPDGDLLQYKIEDPQPGMQFDITNGLFQWEIPTSTSGIQYVTLRVEDSEGGAAAQKVRLDIDFLRENL